MHRWVAAIALLWAGEALAGGMFLPGSGAVSTSRAGTAVASIDTGEALAINPAGLAKVEGTTVTLSMAMIDFAMKFQRRGTYDDIPGVDLPYEGTDYPLVEDGSKAPFGFGGFQPVPVFTITHQLRQLPKLTLALGAFAPNSYPFRKMCTRQGGSCRPYEFNGDADVAPSPVRYDVIQREAVLFMPTIAASYRVLPELDIGARFGWGFSDISSSVAIWASPGNVVEDVGADGVLKVDAKDNFVPSYGAGVTYRPAPAIELAAVYNSEVHIGAKGTAASQLGPRAGSTGIQVMVVPIPDEFARCAPGGVVGKLKACLTAELPRTASLGGRYKFLGADGQERGDVELNVGWENWGNTASTDFGVIIDSEIVTEGGGGFSIKPNVVRHGFQDVYNVRLGGSWRFPVGGNTLIARGGVGHDTASAKPGWARADIDGAARTTIAAGAGYRTKRFQIDAGFGVVLEGSVDNAGTCNPTTPAQDQLGCNGDGVQDPLDQRRGPDPLNPLLVPDQQLQAPVNQGVFDQHYLMIMLGGTVWF